jgi:putative RNA 2'-phosphotransferase
MDAVRLSKRLSLVLRHDPASIGIVLDPAGWVPVPDLVDALNRAGEPVTRAELESVVRTSDKQRFKIDPAGDRIRANQGHSVSVELGLERAVPPEVLFHGTPLRNLEAILREGLLKRSRHAVHLSADVDTAHRVGARRGRPVVLAVAAAEMDAAGHLFTRAANGVWLVDHAPAEYLSRI